MQTNEERVCQLIETLAGFNDTPGQGITRFSYGQADRQARGYILNLFEEMDLTVKVDGAGNIRARQEGTNPALPPLLMGSHMDSVRFGGKYDGIVGVAGAIEVVRTLQEGQIIPERSIEIVIFAEEEGSNFGTTMVGSKTLIGEYGPDKLKELRTEAGKSCFDLLIETGFLSEETAEQQLADSVVKAEDIFAMIELHIEQGIVLERESKKVGVVEAIAGMRTIAVTVEGTSNHAGATPMNLRSDPMVAAADVISAVQKMARYDGRPATVATVGKISCAPNMPNVIPQMVEFTVDIRDVEQAGIDQVTESLQREINRTARRENVTIATRVIGESACIGLSPEIAGVIEDAARALEIPYKRMNSGAVHDAAMLAEIGKVGMIFIPSREGKSHNPWEYTSPEEIKIGCDALLLAAWFLACA